MADLQRLAQLDPIRPVLDTALDAVVVMTADGHVAAWNKVAEEVFGWTAKEAAGRIMADLIIPEGFREAHALGLARYLSTGEERVVGRRIEIAACRRDGGEFPIELSITTSQAGGETLFIGFLRDISARHEAEARLRRQAQETQLLFDVTRMAAASGSFEEALEVSLRAICELIGWPVGHALILKPGTASELVSTNVWHEAEPGIADRLKAQTARIRFTAGMGLPGHIIETGEPAWFGDVGDSANFPRRGLGFSAAFGFPVRSGDRILAVLEFFSTAVAAPDDDLILTVRTLGEQVGRVLERKRTEEHQRLLINELNHRVKNTLAIVQSIAHQTLKGANTADGTRQSLENRLAALAGAHDLLTSENWEAASLASVVRSAGMGCGASEARFFSAGPDVRLQPQTAVSVAMAIHELCTNALKYGALSNEAGAVNLRWDVESAEDGARRLRLVWEESGGPAVAPPPRRGFGTRLIERGLASDLGGTARIAFHPEGVVCTVEAPLPPDEPAPPGG
jgi:PAS domain S-box-containing protein